MSDEQPALENKQPAKNGFLQRRRKELVMCLVAVLAIAFAFPSKFLEMLPGKAPGKSWNKMRGKMISLQLKNGKGFREAFDGRMVHYELLEKTPEGLWVYGPDVKGYHYIDGPAKLFFPWENIAHVWTSSSPTE